MRYLRNVLFESGDGPDGITIYTSFERAAVDHAGDEKALYIEICVNGASVQMGPFMRKVRVEMEQAFGVAQ